MYTKIVDFFYSLLCRAAEEDQKPRICFLLNFLYGILFNS